jgi:hypothetical protein
MNTLGARLRIIPRTAWFIAVLVYVGFVLFAASVPMRHDPEMSNWPLAAKVAFAGLMPLFLSVYVLLIGFVHADAKRRGMRYVMWTWLAVLVPNAIGIILYFLLRDPLPQPCPSCRVVLAAGFTFCPHCGTALRPTCPQCGKSVERGWGNCAYCGTKLPVNGQKTEIGK